MKREAGQEARAATLTRIFTRGHSPPSHPYSDGRGRNRRFGCRCRDRCLRSFPRLRNLLRGPFNEGLPYRLGLPTLRQTGGLLNIVDGRLADPVPLRNCQCGINALFQIRKDRLSDCRRDLRAFPGCIRALADDVLRVGGQFRKGGETIFRHDGHYLVQRRLLALGVSLDRFGLKSGNLAFQFRDLLFRCRVHKRIVS